MNLNELARHLCEHEGGPVQVNIAQMKEVIRKLGVLFNTLNSADQFALLAKICKAAGQ